MSACKAVGEREKRMSSFFIRWTRTVSSCVQALLTFVHTADD